VVDCSGWPFLAGMTAITPFRRRGEDGCWDALKLHPISRPRCYWAKLLVNGGSGYLQCR
jgi:hypothetical protein